MRILFLGSGAFGIPTLHALAALHEVVGIVSQPARPAGRRRAATPTPVAAHAATMSCPLHCTVDVNRDETVQWALALKPEVAVVVAFGQKLCPELIGVIGHVVINLHASLLPKYRGAAPINWAIVRGERRTGVSVISIVDRMDAGLVYAQRSVTIGVDETAGELHDRLADLGPEVIEEVLAAAAMGALRGSVQDETLVTHAPKLTKGDGAVSFNEKAGVVCRRIHGMTPWPSVRVAWVRRAKGQRVPLILRRVAQADGIEHAVPPGTLLEGQRVAVQCGAVQLLEVQMPGKRPMAIGEFVRGNPMLAGDRLE